MFLSLFCKAFVLSAIFIVTQTFAYRVVPNNYELDKILDSKMLNELLTKLRFHTGPTNEREKKSEATPLPVLQGTTDRYAENDIKPSDVKTPETEPKKRDIAELALYPAFERALEKSQGPPERKAYVFDEFMIYEA